MTLTRYEFHEHDMDNYIVGIQFQLAKMLIIIYKMQQLLSL